MDQVTFCIQGPLFSSEGEKPSQAQRLHDSIRYHFKGAKVIVSTWDQDRDGEFAGPDAFTYSKDPGSGLRYLTGEYNNINRQIVSSRAALNLVETRFAVKLRSDMLFIHGGLRKMIALYETRHRSSWSIMNGRILVLDRQTYSPTKWPGGGLSFHVSDHFQFGLAQDLKVFWDIPLMSNLDEDYFLPEAQTNPQRNIHIPRWRAEQYFWLQNASRVFEISSTSSTWDNAQEYLAVTSEDFFLDNLIPLKSTTLGLRSQKYRWTLKDDLISSTYAYTYDDWRNATLRRDEDSLAIRPSLFVWERICSYYWRGVKLLRALFPVKKSKYP